MTDLGIGAAPSGSSGAGWQRSAPVASEMLQRSEASPGSGNWAVVELFCRVSPEIATQRFAERGRHEGHRDDDRFHEVASWIASAAPLGIGALRELDTTHAVDVPAIAHWVREAFA